MALTRDEIFQAILDVESQGVNPTQARVRAKLGRGSNSQIQPVLRQWRESMGDGIKRSSLPLEEMPVEILELFQRAWTKAVIAADERSVVEQVELLERENERLNQDLYDYRATKQELEGLRTGFNVVLGQLNELTRQNERMVQFQEQAEQFDEIRRQRDAFVETNALFSQDIERQQGQIARLEEVLESERKTVQVSQQRANELSDQLSEALQRGEKSERQLVEAADSNIRLREDFEAASTALGEKLAEISELQNEHRLLKEQVANSDRRADKAETEKSRFEALINELQKREAEGKFPQPPAIEKKPTRSRSKRKLLEGEQLPLAKGVQQAATST